MVIIGNREVCNFSAVVTLVMNEIDPILLLELRCPRLQSHLLFMKPWFTDLCVPYFFSLAFYRTVHLKA